MPTTSRGYRVPGLTDAPNGPAQLGDLAADIDADVTRVAGVYVMKPLAEGRHSTVAPSADADLQFPVVAGAKYDVTMYLHFSGPAATGLRTAWSAPSGTIGNRMVLGPASNASDTDGDHLSVRMGVHQLSTEIVYDNTRGVGSFVWAQEHAVITAGADGTLALTWAQLASNATDTVLGAGSYLTYRRIA